MGLQGPSKNTMRIEVTKTEQTHEGKYRPIATKGDRVQNPLLEGKLITIPTMRKSVKTKKSQAKIVQVVFWKLPHSFAIQYGGFCATVIVCCRRAILKIRLIPRSSIQDPLQKSKQRKI